MNNNYTILNNGIQIPTIGFGTFRAGSDDETKESVKSALRLGYRYIDAASFYKNEIGVGQGIKESDVPREEIFLVSKLWNDEQGYENAIEAFKRSIEKLDVDYLDLYLIHWPTKLNDDTWKALEYLYKEGKVRAIGVCNFKKNHLEALIRNSQIKPAVNQIEVHPNMVQNDTIEYCEKNDIKIIGWAPLARGKIFSMSLMQELSEKYNKDISQITLRWHLQKGVIPIPKSSKLERIKSNLGIFDFELSKEEIEKIDKLDKGESVTTCPPNTLYVEGSMYSEI